MQPIADSHVHSEWSWDGLHGDMDGTCARAVDIGLSAITFTEHVDFTPFRAGHLVEKFGPLVTDGTLNGLALDVEGYVQAVKRCRSKYPTLRILSRVEVGQPHAMGNSLLSFFAGEVSTACSARSTAFRMVTGSRNRSNSFPLPSGTSAP